MISFSFHFRPFTSASALPLLHFHSRLRHSTFALLLPTSLPLSLPTMHIHIISPYHTIPYHIAWLCRRKGTRRRSTTTLHHTQSRSRSRSQSRSQSRSRQPAVNAVVVAEPRYHRGTRSRSAALPLGSLSRLTRSHRADLLACH